MVENQPELRGCVAGLVSFHVERQVIRSGKTSVALRTLEWLDPSVFPVMPCQLVGSSETPLTAFPGATIRFLTWKAKEKES